jgi:hypothetical protein
MHHFGGNVDRAFAANENDAPPVPFLHAGQIRTTQAHAAQDVDFEEPPPFLVGNFNKRLGLKNSQVIDQDVHCRETLDQIFGSRSCGQVSGESLDFRFGRSLPNLFQGGINTVIRTSVHDHASAFRGQLAGYGETNALGRAGN